MEGSVPETRIPGNLWGYLPHSFQGSLFPENHQNPGENSCFLKERRLKRMGNQPLEARLLFGPQEAFPGSVESCELQNRPGLAHIRPTASVCWTASCQMAGQKSGNPKMACPIGKWTHGRTKTCGPIPGGEKNNDPYPYPTSFIAPNGPIP